MKTFDTCALPEVCFFSIGSEPKKPVAISDCDNLFIDMTVEKRYDEEWAETALEYRKVTAEIKALEKRQKQLRDALISMSEHSNCVGGGLRVEKLVRRGTINYPSIPELQGIDLDQYRGEMTTYWKVSEI